MADAILARFERDPEKMLAFAMAATKTDFARFAPLVFEHAAARDPLALALVEEAAGHIAAMVARLLDCGAPAVALIGGLAEPITPWLPPFTVHRRLSTAMPGVRRRSATQ